MNFIDILIGNVAQMVEEVNPYQFLYKIGASFMFVLFMFVMTVFVSLIVFQYQMYVLLYNGTILISNLLTSLLGSFL